ncbi:dermonecrotic toxin domain-containing protein [Pseudomonas sp. PSB11]|uniref:dermonecrotic toxin domain-containing protein n=1 Tax=Pseudomonas sp. PSB11 TaxID=2021969 RepID=UPI0016603614|nr:DUF6543 domain-containing protein [Pseudomonas sp. PSB11]MBD0678973.1 hypothetical protein [Pseudomonas sp. PSB11]
MTERLLPTLLPPSLSTPSPIVMPEFSTLPGTIDQTLLQRALSRWQACQEGLQSLFADAPPNVGADAYWNARAPGTPLSRRDRASQLYRDHIEATAHAGFALGSLSAEQLKPLWQVLDAETAAMGLDDQLIHCEHLALKLSDNSIRKLPAAWVISVGNQQPAAQLLYLPSRPIPVQAFDERGDMEHWLSAQLLAPPELPSHYRFEYTAGTGPLTTGIAQLFTPGVQPRIAEVFAQAPTLANLELTEGLGDEDQSSPFDSLSADIPRALRQASLGKQRAALETLLGEAFDSDRQQALDDTLKALETAALAADTGASTVLYRSRTLDLITFNRGFNALYQAHKDGLKAEVELQRTLNQLDDTELDWLKVLLDTPDTAEHDPDAAFASLSLSMATDTGEPLRHELDGVFVIACSQALSDPDSPHSLLLYWPGIGGGLQRFANRKDLEQQLLKIQRQDPVLALQLTTISTDPLRYSLNRQISHFEEQAAQIRRRYPDSTPASQRAQELEKLRRQTLALLQVPVNAARSLALTHLQEQRRSASMVARLPTWLATLAAPDAARLKSLTSACIQALQRSHEQLETILIPRTTFTRRHLQAQLRKDFSLKGDFDVQLDLPDSVTLQKQLTDGAAPGTPQKLVAVPSTARSKMTLEELAQLNIDNTPSMQLEPLSLRLGFMRVEVTTLDDSERRTLTTGITHAYLRKTLPALNLPKTYEQLIHDTFMGSHSEPLFVREHRRECLIEPWRQTLKLQGECARLQRQISFTDLQILDIAIDADTPQAWHADGKRIEILPAYLNAGGKDTPNEGPVTLSGVTFIQEQVSGVTLLYLPDSPDGQCLRRYGSLEQARKALFNLCLNSEMVSYLAGRALQGDVRAHESRINQAVLKHFDAMIGVGMRWPALTSLAAHLLNTQMGRLVEAHRGTSRSNDALFLERYALSGPKALNYIKMAVGVVPFVGTAVSLYDAWSSANQAVAALLRADVGEGLAEIESVLLSLIDAAMDILPGTSGTRTATGARALTRARQLGALGNGAMALPQTSRHQARHIAERFAGYEYEKPISLLGLKPARHGIYRNVYRHADGDFITRQGRIFQVEPSKDSRGWRLSGTRKKTYKQPVALDEAGRWDTWFGVYGSTFEGGGLGGGGALGHLADTLDPLWPATIRERLPRWWADRVFRRNTALTSTADNLAPQLDSQVQRTNAALEHYNNSSVQARPALLPATEAACIGDIELAGRHYQTLVELTPLTHGNKRRALKDMQSHDALVIADRQKQRVFFANHRADPLMGKIDALVDQLDALPDNALAERIRILHDIRKLRVEFIGHLEQMETAMRELNRWYERITVSSEKAQLTPEVTMLNGRLSESNLLYLKTGHLLETVKRFDTTKDLSWFHLQAQADSLRTKVDRALFTQYSLAEVSATRAQRNQILQECLEHYRQFRRGMNAWTASYPQHFHLDAVGPLLEGIEKMAERARKAIDLPAPVMPAGQRSKKVFMTEDDHLLIGVERWEPTTQKRQYILTGQGGVKEIWEQAANGKFRLLNPPQPTARPAHRDPGAMVEEARSRLQSQPAYQAKIEAYAAQDMLPVDLEHMMVSEAGELSRRALDIEAVAPQSPVIAQLRNKATELISTGRLMRTRQSLSSKNPTDGMLDDLISQNAVEIRKTSPIKSLRKRPDGRADYLQEYEIWDRTAMPPNVLWYAHFHYGKAASAFAEFEKAHLKLPQYRFLTHADDATLPYADIGKRSPVLRHFDQV